MYIKCKKCEHKESFGMDLLVKIIGGAMPIGGFWAWVTYFFAGTGFAFPICAALVSGGVGILIFKDDIVKWLSSKYDCKKCGTSDWDLMN